MRIKCPNSDIFLELPGDRTDMKFTCPACGKVHRVTVNISTPGEEPAQPAKNTRTMPREQPQIPKKYATGAFAPVVDIPIDANFVLVDGNARAGQQGIDLGQAAAPSQYLDRELANRKTEIIDRRPESERRQPAPGPAATTQPPPEAAPPRADSEDTTRDEAPADARPESRRLWEEAPEPGGKTSSRPLAASKRTTSRDGAAPGKNRRGAGAVLVLLLLLALAGFLGWQQYRRGENRKALEAHLLAADSAWKKGEVPAAAKAARHAEADLARENAFHTPVNLWNRAVAWSGYFAPLGQPDIESEAKIRAHLERNRSLEAFKKTLDPADAAAMAETLADAVASQTAGDPNLAEAMRRAVVDAALRNLRSRTAASPEEAADAARGERLILAPALSPASLATLDAELKEFAAVQRERLLEEVGQATASIASAAAAGEADALTRYLALAERLAGGAGEADLSKPLPELAAEADRPALAQLSRLAELTSKATQSARTVLSRQDVDEYALDEIRKSAAADTQPNSAMSAQAVIRIEAAQAQADELVSLRSEVFARVQADMRRNRDYSGSRLAWSMLRMGFEDPAIAIDPSGFRFDSNHAAIAFSIQGQPASMAMAGDEFQKLVRASVGGFTFTTGWYPLFHKPVSWMAGLSLAMREAGVSPARHPNWEVLEGPAGPVALALPPKTGSTNAMPNVRADSSGGWLFFAGKLHRAITLPQPVDAAQVVEDFRLAAVRLHDGVMSDDSIAQPLRQALKPILMGAYQKPSEQDYFDSAFCRRLLEANYLESYIKPMPEGRRRDLEAYRAALGKLEAGRDEFAVQLDDGSRLVAVAGLDPDLSGSTGGGDQDLETGESLPRFSWRWEKGDETIFYSPLPSRFVYAFMLAEHYPGTHRAKPPGRPRLTEVWHATKGRIASYASGAEKAVGDVELWNRAIAEDSSGRFDPSTGQPGWNFPLHVLERDDQGDPLTLATLTGVVQSPNFLGIANPTERRRAEDAWLDSTARTLRTPGELGLIFHQFFRYCSDSPLPELPNLIGSHFGLSDTHQTVYESLERRWVGRLIGDCDDLAEFFQVLTRKQGKLSHVMQLPSHAACGYVERTGENGAGDYRFIVLQTGPTLQFTAASLNDAVLTAYRSFDRDDGLSHLTADAVPLLLRFANEETRTPFVLSARIYEDADYAETMIRVQGYWHEYVFSAALKVMEDMVVKDPEIGSVKELGSLYERVAMYEKSAELRRRELGMVKDNAQSALSTLLEIAQLHTQDNDKEKALSALGEMETRMQEMIRRDDAPGFFQAMSFRSYWAMHLARLGQPARAWNLIRYDAAMTKRQLGRIAEPVLRTMVALYDRMSLQRAASGGTLPRLEEAAAREVRQELEEAFGRGFFKSDDAYNTVISRYFVLGRYAVSDLGRRAGLAKLLQDGPYPDGPRDQQKRGRVVDEEDWKWFRITPQLYLALAMEMLDKDEYPELYDPAGAKPLLEKVSRAIAKGAGLGSDVAADDILIRSEMTLSFLNLDPAAFRKCLAIAKEKDYARLYDDAAMTFGLLGGLIPQKDFPSWIEIFREFLPGTQHYFKVVYRAIDKGNYDHALLMAEATARFFPDNQLLRQEADFVRGIIPGLKARQLEREKVEQEKVEQEKAEREKKPGDAAPRESRLLLTPRAGQ